VRLAFKLFDSEGVALVNLLRDGSDALDEMWERARDPGIVLDESLVRDAERARTELDTHSQVISANLIRAALEATPVIADFSGWLGGRGRQGRHRLGAAVQCAGGEESSDAALRAGSDRFDHQFLPG
jgi:hypothetical protein